MFLNNADHIDSQMIRPFLISANARVPNANQESIFRGPGVLESFCKKKELDEYILQRDFFVDSHRQIFFSLWSNDDANLI